MIEDLMTPLDPVEEFMSFCQQRDISALPPLSGPEAVWKRLACWRGGALVETVASWEIRCYSLLGCCWNLEAQPVKYFPSVPGSPQPISGMYREEQRMELVWSGPPPGRRKGLVILLVLHPWLHNPGWPWGRPGVASSVYGCDLIFRLALNNGFHPPPHSTVS
ncbi:hypothetical protein AMECASPLE_037780 [Ameca splendens]|uniref:Uncharacterized protein n=1 Tax=Ameca splendens TaxID=208324 RepID=A0ABV0XXB5_9TELE